MSSLYNSIIRLCIYKHDRDTYLRLAALNVKNQNSKPSARLDFHLFDNAA